MHTRPQTAHPAYSPAQASLRSKTPPHCEAEYRQKRLRSKSTSWLSPCQISLLFYSISTNRTSCPSPQRRSYRGSGCSRSPPQNTDAPCRLIWSLCLTPNFLWQREAALKNPTVFPERPMQDLTCTSPQAGSHRCPWLLHPAAHGCPLLNAFCRHKQFFCRPAKSPLRL